MKEDDIVITGLGVATAVGYGVNEFMDNIYKARSSYKPHKQLKSTASINHVVAYADDAGLVSGIDARKARKLDRFCLLAMQAFRHSYDYSGLNQGLSHDFGILLGNSTGGWSYVEPQLDEIYNGNYEDLSPYVATAWFPTAPQGEISIHYKIAGYSKTFSADALSAGYALDHAIYLINNGYLPGAFVGAVESPLSPLVYNACVHSNDVSFSGQYHPFSSHSDGYLLGEGSGVITLEKYGNANERGQASLARIAGVGIGSSLSSSITNCLDIAKQTPESIDCIFLDAKGSVNKDALEIEELESLFASCYDVLLTTAKPLYGHLLDADFAVEIVIAVETLLRQKIPCGLFSKNEPHRPNFGKLVVDEPITTPLKNVLVYACNAQGTSISVLIEKINQ